MCKNADGPLELYSSPIPLLSMREIALGAKQMPPGYVCGYDFLVYGNEDNSQMLELTVDRLSEAKLGLSITQLQPDGANLTVDQGFFHRHNCSVVNNCSVNMEG
jgi:hypothetical protein